MIYKKAGKYPVFLVNMEFNYIKTGISNNVLLQRW